MKTARYTPLLPHLVKDRVAESVTCRGNEVQEMNNRNQRGFSMVELLIVVVIIGIIASLAVPALQKAIRAAENGTTFATMKTMASTQTGLYHQNGRFGRLLEVNNVLSGGVGTQSGNNINRGKFVISMVPPVPTDLELRDSYTIEATRNVVGEGVIYKYEITQAGQVRQISPLP